MTPTELALWLVMSVHCVTPTTKAPLPLVRTQVTRFIGSDEWVILRPDGTLTRCRCTTEKESKP